MTEQKGQSENKNRYNPSEIEPKWQNYWLENQTFKVEADASKKKYYVLDMFPYPSGAGLHVGHPEGYTATDILCRFKRMKGFNVLHPMGWDSFGLPAEQYALETGTHPAITTKKNIDNFRRQIQSLGFSYDWSREVATSDATYYKWTQWIFIQLYKKGLAYIDEVPVNWCPALGTVLANEEVIDGKSERGGHDVVRKPMRQWILKITDYADSLLDGLDELDWPESIKEMQRNWIGKSEGLTLDFEVDSHPNTKFSVFTTRPDTLFGATYCVLAPEHEIATKILSNEQKQIALDYIEKAKNKSDRKRQEDVNEKTGVFSGAYAINAANKKRIPIYIADYVLSSYGTGAIMAVPAHDKRDYDFAKKFSLEIIPVLEGGDITKEAFVGNGIHINSNFLNGLDKNEAISKMLNWAEEQNIGKRTVNYKLRDWLFSRQRYWGEPFPIVHGEDGHKVIEENELPVILPEIEKYQPTEDGEPPLARAKEWLKYTDPKTAKELTRETNTMPQWAGSCWYYLRYIDPLNEKAAWDKEKEKYWMPVDLYIGGAEHAVLHLLYSRFWHHVLYDLGLVSTKEPFKKLVNQGMILGEDSQKMSKSRGNVVNPDDIVAEFGADTLRLYEMFMGPLEQVKPWNPKSVGGIYKFLSRVWNLVINQDGDLNQIISANTKECSLEKNLHKTIKKVGEDTENLKFNTAISAMMSFINDAYKASEISLETIKSFILILAPYAPHLSEELWEKTGSKTSLAYHPWPTFDPKLIVEDTVTVAIQVNGKMRGKIDVPQNTDKDELIKLAQEVENVAAHIQGKTPKKIIAVPGRMVNFVL